MTDNHVVTNFEEIDEQLDSDFEPCDEDAAQELRDHAGELITRLQPLAKLSWGMMSTKDLQERVNYLRELKCKIETLFNLATGEEFELVYYLLTDRGVDY